MEVSHKQYILILLIFLTGPCCGSGQEDPASEYLQVKLVMIAEGFAAPIGLISPMDESNRMFIVDQTGVIRIINGDGQLVEEPFLDLRERMVQLMPNYDERGLLGLAFHPQFEENGRFFVYYSAPLREKAPPDWDCTMHVSEFKISNEDENKADPDSEKIILQIDEPQFNHNGGDIVFGPDGYLYISVGDGGAADDVGLGHAPEGNGQNTLTFLGKILRIDVEENNGTNGNAPYGIPFDNPFLDRYDAIPEIFAYGLRNPFRMSFDSGGDHDLFVADVGQNLWEEVNIVTKGGNYGWNIKEGTHCFDPESSMESPITCPGEDSMGRPLTDPIIEYGHDQGASVIGGYVYRGQALPELMGNYIFADWSNNFEKGNGKLFIAIPSEEDKLWPIKEIKVANRPYGQVDAFIRAFGQDENGELYALTSDVVGLKGNSGRIYKLTPAH